MLAVVPPSGSRMPNGIGAELLPPRGGEVSIGDGSLLWPGVDIRGGPVWRPRPGLIGIAWGSPGTIDVDGLAGRGEGLTPEGDDVIAGYVAGLTLFHRRRTEARELAARAARLTTSLSATLLRHAAEGELPEPAHRFLADGAEGPLRSFGHTSGTALLRGFRLAGAIAHWDIARGHEKLPVGGQGIPS